VVTASNLLHPPPRRVTCPVIDAHAHVGRVDETSRFLQAAELYGVDRVLGITSLAGGRELEDRFPGRFVFAISLDYRLRDDPKRFQRENLARLRRAYAAGFRVVKFWFKPAFNADTGVFLDDHRLTPIFELMGELGMPGLVHIADPDIWWATHYGEVARYGTKLEAYTQLENVLSKHPETTIIGAHFGGHPEDLDHLARLLDTYPNYRIDTSATKWVSRELGRQPERAREFVMDYAERILFGSDLVVREGWPVGRYAQRYWVQQMLLEGQGEFLSPIPDGDYQEILRRQGREVTEQAPVFTGLELPGEVLVKLYYTNAVELLSLETSKCERGGEVSRCPR